MTWLEQQRRKHRLAAVPSVPPVLFAVRKPTEEIENGVGLFRAIVGPGTVGTAQGTVVDSHVSGSKPGVEVAPFRLVIPPEAVGVVDGFLRNKFSGLPLLVLDLETYYDREFSLSKLEPLPYITDPRFHIHGLAIRHPDGRAEFRMDARAALDELKVSYGEQLEKAAVVMHNAYFDALALNIHYGFKAVNMIDTMLLSRLRFGASVSHDLRSVAERLRLPAKGHLEFMEGVRHPTPEQVRQLTEYAILDVELTHDIAVQLLPYALHVPLELWAMEFSIRQLVERPLGVDATAVTEGLKSLSEDVQAAIDRSGYSAAQLRSAEKFADALDLLLATTGRKTTRKQGKTGQIPALSKKDHAAQQLFMDADPKVRSLMEARRIIMSEPMQHSRLDFLRVAAERLGKVHLQLSYGVAGPGRFQGGGGFNAQNLSKRAIGGELISASIRRAIRAPAGYVFVSADAAQIEARILAYMAGETALHASFARGEDVYSDFAAAQFSTKVRKPRPGDPEELAAKMKVLRQVGKQAILGLGYGMGVEKFNDTLRAEPMLQSLFDAGELTTGKIAGIQGNYRKRYPNIPKFWSDCEYAFRSAMVGVASSVAGCKFSCAGSTVTITLRSGRAIVYPDTRLDTHPPTPRSYIDASGRHQTFTPTAPGILYAEGKNVYGGLIAENIVQATARDILVHVLYRLETTGFNVVFHCHDSVTVLSRASEVPLVEQALIQAWTTVPSWSPGLVLAAETVAGANFHEI